MIRTPVHFQTMRIPKALFLLIVLLTGCAQAAGSPTEIIQTAGTLPTPTFQSSVSTEVSTLEPGVVDVTPIVTPRGLNLVATDPSTVGISAGKLQLVEFFRFT